MASVLPFDELNRFEETLPMFFNEEGKIKSKEDYDSLLDMMEDFFLLAYANGVEITNLSLGSDIKADIAAVEKTVNKPIEGKTWRQRMEDYYRADMETSTEKPTAVENAPIVSANKPTHGTIADVIRIIETEAHRDSNAGAYETARKAGATQKVWHTMLDDRVRDSHQYLEGVVAPIDGEFYSFAGNHTQYPGQWGIAEEDVGCRCYLTFK